MAKNNLTYKPVKTPLYYGWVIVFIAGLGVFFSGPGQTYSVSMFIDSYIIEFGWSRSFVSSLYSIGTLLAGMILPMVGRLVDRLGSRVMVTALAAVFGLVCLFMSIVGSPLMLFIGFFLVRLLGQGSMTLTSSTLVPQWFVKKRGRALSLMALGGTLGSAGIPLINTWLIRAYDWRLGWQVWGLLLLLIMVPAAWLLIRNRPEDLGLRPDNATDNKVNDSAVLLSAPISLLSSAAEEDDAWTLRGAMRTRTFWLLMFCATIPSAINTGLTFHLASIMHGTGFDLDIAPVMAAVVLSTVAIVQLPFNFVAGFLADKYKVHYLMAIAFFGQLLSLVFLLNVRSTSLAISFGVLWGILTGFYFINSGVVWPNYYGRKYLGSIRGMAMTAMVIGSAFGPLPFGFAYDLFGGYREILLLSMLFPVLGIAAALLSPPPPTNKAGISHK